MHVSLDPVDPAWSSSAHMVEEDRHCIEEPLKPPKWDDDLVFKLQCAELMSVLSSAVTAAPRPFCRLGPPCCSRGLKLSFVLVVLAKPSPAAASYLAVPAAGAKGGAVPEKLFPDGRGCGGFPCLAAGGMLRWVRPLELAFLVKYRAVEGLGSVLHWRGEGDLPGAAGGWRNPHEQLGWMVDFTQ